MLAVPFPPRSVAPSRLLLVSCSGEKHFTTEAVPAWHLYQGVSFRVLKRAVREGRWPTDLDVVILSARYGILAPDQPVLWYEERMTQQRAGALQHPVHLALDRILRGRGYRQLLVQAGRVYRQALRLTPTWMPPGVSVHVATGGIGEQLHQLRTWLDAQDGLSSGWPEKS